MNQTERKLRIAQALTETNSSGQGYDAAHSTHSLHATITEAGYKYSHTTPTRGLTRDYLLHTYEYGEHKVSIHHDDARYWETTTSCGSGHKWSGLGEAELRAHLRSKGRRYSLASNR